MDEQCNPSRHAKRQCKLGANAFGTCSIGMDRNVAVRRRVCVQTLWVELESRVTLVWDTEEGVVVEDLSALHCNVVVAHSIDSAVCCEHDEAQTDDRASVNPGANHPGAMLVDLESLNVVICETERDGRQRGNRANSSLSVGVTTSYVPRYHEDTCETGEEKAEYNVAIDAVEDE